MGLIPFLVADRPASLNLLRGLDLGDSKKKIGIMTHALTSKKYWDINKNFPEIREGNNQYIKEENIIKMADSGIFNKGGCNLTYFELFNRYKRLGVDYGIMIDILGDSHATIKSAIKAQNIYSQNNFKFKLVAVAQGKNLEDYLNCYERLSEKFEYIAIGGLLKKNLNSARYVNITNEEFMYNIIRIIKKDFSPEWLFVLGCYHPSRHSKFEKLGVWGSDYKGWIFNYDSRIDSLKKLHNKLKDIEMTYKTPNHFSDLITYIKKTESRLKYLISMKRRIKTPKKKKEYYHKIKDIKDQLMNSYNQVMIARKNIIENMDYKDNNEYLTNLNLFKEILGLNSDQSWRFLQVREYIENYIIKQLF